MVKRFAIHAPQPHIYTQLFMSFGIEQLEKINLRGISLSSELYQDIHQVTKKTIKEVSEGKLEPVQFDQDGISDSVWLYMSERYILRKDIGLGCEQIEKSKTTRKKDGVTVEFAGGRDRSRYHGRKLRKGPYVIRLKDLEDSPVIAETKRYVDLSDVVNVVRPIYEDTEIIKKVEQLRTIRNRMIEYRRQFSEVIETFAEIIETEGEIPGKCDLCQRI